MFLISTILNLISSYLIASVFSNFLIIYISFFALIILNVEILSLFNGIYDYNLLIFSIFNFIISFIFFKKTKSNFLKPIFNFKRLKNALFLDKSLLILSFCFLVFLSVSFFIAYIMPPLEPDAQTYHFLRALEFSKNHNLNHFDINDIRALIMPINSEIVYCWIYTLKHKIYNFALLSYFSYIAIICAIWSILEYFKFSYRKRIFTIFIFSSLASIIVQISSLQTDIVVGALLICAFSLFIKKQTYFSSLSIALAMGVKSTGVMALIGFFILIILYEKLIHKKIIQLPKFLRYLIINFFIFSSYNYILNFIQFNNPISNNSAYQGHCFWGGFEGFIANIINFIFQMFDFTGFMWGYYLNYKILALKELIFNLININSMTGINVNLDMVNISADEQIMGFGILGFLVFLPAIIISLFKFNKNNKNRLFFILSIVFIINLCVLARSMAYMIFSIRFIVSFVCLSSIIIAIMYYKKGLYKTIVVLFSIFYLLILPFFITRAPFFKIINNLKLNNYNIEAFHKDCFERKIIPIFNLSQRILKVVSEKYLNVKKIGIFKNLSSPMLYLKILNNYEIDFLTAANIDEYNLNQYDLIIFIDKLQNDNIFNENKVQIDYEMKNNNIYFKNNSKINCYYNDIANKITQNNKLAIERYCFSYEYMKKNKQFKLDYIDNFQYEKNRNLEIYYYVKSN